MNQLPGPVSPKAGDRLRLSRRVNRHRTGSAARWAVECEIRVLIGELLMAAMAILIEVLAYMLPADSGYVK